MFVRRLYSEPRFATPYSLGNPGLPPDEGLYRGLFRREDCR
jgi:hypothetical protein